jgi:hypothetical protein
MNPFRVDKAEQITGSEMQKTRDRGACGAFRRARHFQFFEPIASPKTLVGSERKKPQEENLLGRGVHTRPSEFVSVTVID